ncbi:N-acetylmuramoyl-L-alanine amidase [Pectinatus brassicae]|uniref:N-acetylmuramoyl-L-alanine amidase n=1 Tax=Pectinatus brassicae TaxID=862415 RepID=A0A840UG45_9FIRM|nr:N-acetylmuramoyl-L-alanine amidase [Pectinatus brassicae]MBB5335979.1 hypothetical protein [Pectinatus brassicae]
MKKIEIEDLQRITELSKRKIWKIAKRNGRDPKLYLHWSAKRYEDKFENYHINITGDGEVYISTENFADILTHTFHRNRGAIGIVMCCGYESDTDCLGSFAPTLKQIEVMSRIIAIVAEILHVTIDLKHVMTHGEAADNEDGMYLHDPYGPRSTGEEWDLEYLGTNDSHDYNPWAANGTRGGDVLRKKALLYEHTLIK